MNTSLRIHRMTLLEVLVSMTILMLIMTFLAKMLHSVTLISRRQQQQSELYQAQRQLFSVLSLDLKSIVTSATPDEEIRCNFNPTPATFPGFGSSPVAAQFICNSGLGVINDNSMLQEVIYVRHDTEVYRYYTRQSAGTAWDFYANPVTNNWRSTWSDCALVADFVEDFYMTAYDSGGTELTSDVSSTPAYIVATVVLRDAADNSSRTFKKKIFSSRGN